LVDPIVDETLAICGDVIMTVRMLALVLNLVP
jgi:hypothetical protein